MVGLNIEWKRTFGPFQLLLIEQQILFHNLTRTRSQAVAKIADRTATQQTRQ